MLRLVLNINDGGGINMMLGMLLKYDVIVSAGQATRDRRRWRNLWREIFAWQQKGIADYERGRMGSTPLGRKYTAKMMTDQLNIENQGAGADVAKLALHYLDTDQYEETDIINFVHDSYLIECPDDPKVYEAVSAHLAESMQTAWFEMSKVFNITDLPMPVTVTVGTNLETIEDEPMFEYSV